MEQQVKTFQMQFVVVGMRYRGCTVDDVQDPLTLVAEPTSPYDSYAIQVWSGDHHVGYVSRDTNQDVFKTIQRYGVGCTMSIHHRFAQSVVVGLLPPDEVSAAAKSLDALSLKDTSSPAAAESKAPLRSDGMMDSSQDGAVASRSEVASRTVSKLPKTVFKSPHYTGP